MGAHLRSHNHANFAVIVSGDVPVNEEALLLSHRDFLVIHLAGEHLRQNNPDTSLELCRPTCQSF